MKSSAKVRRQLRRADTTDGRKAEETGALPQAAALEKVFIRVTMAKCAAGARSIVTGRRSLAGF